MHPSYTDTRTPLWMEYCPASFHPYIHLARYDRMAALWILFFPCLWCFALFGIAEVPNTTLLLFFFGGLCGFLRRR